MNKKWFFPFAFLFLLSLSTFATHILAGYINVERITRTSFTHIITIVAYTDLDSDVQFGSGVMTFGDGSDSLSFKNLAPVKRQQISLDVMVNIFEVQHTFPGNGVFTIGYREFTRNAETLNMDNSVNTPFYIETTIKIDPLVGAVSNILLNPPVLSAISGSTFTFAPYVLPDAPFDDQFVSEKLLFFKAIPSQEKNIPVVNYRFPDHPEFTGSNNEYSYSVDTLTGLVTWNIPPELTGQFALSINIVKYREINAEFVEVASSILDIQVIITEQEKETGLDLLSEPCLNAGESKFEFDVIADAPYRVDLSRSNYYYPAYPNLLINGKLMSDVSDSIYQTDSFFELEFLDQDTSYQILGFGIKNAFFEEGLDFASFNIVRAESCEIIVPEILQSRQILITSAKSDLLDIKFYPNPVTNYIQLENTVFNRVDVINVNGKVIKTIHQMTSSINVADLSAGNYLLKIYQNDETSHVVKFVKN